MKTSYRNAFFILLVLIYSCQPKEQSSIKTDNEMIKSEVKEQFNQLISALNNSDSFAWSEFYSKDEFLSSLVSTDFYATRSAFIDSIKKYFSMRENQNVEPLKVQVTALTPVIALMTSQEKTKMRFKNSKNITSQHVYTMLWKKEQNGWKIIHSHESWIEQQE